MPENIHHLTRLQRLAAIGVSLPERSGAPRLSPTRLRSLLKHPLVSGPEVRANEDPYEDIYVLEIPFHGGPRRVVQGLAAQSAAVLNLLLPAIMHAPGGQLPDRYREQVELATDVLLNLSETICEAVGLRRGTIPPYERTSDVMVPGQGRLDALCEAVSITHTKLDMLPEPVVTTIEYFSIRPGELGWQPENPESDQLILTPLLRTATRLIVANPGELAAALRHRIICLAEEHGCQAELAQAYQTTAYAEAHRLLMLSGAQARTPELKHATALLTRRRYTIADDKIIDLIVVTDDLVGYRADWPSGAWGASGVGEAIASWFEQAQDTLDEANTLQLVILAGLGRIVMVGLPTRGDGPQVLMMRLDELDVITQLDGADPLCLWNFAVARRRLRANTKVIAFSTLDLYALYRDHDYSFCLSDERPMDVISVECDMGLPLRVEAIRRADIHQVPSPRRPVFVEVVAEHGSDIAPIYVSLGRQEAGDLLIELDGAYAWVLYDNPSDLELDTAFEVICSAAAYWLWQIDTRLPGLLAAVAFGGLLIAELSMDDPTAWSRFYNGHHHPDVGSGWIEVTCPHPGRLEARLLAAGAPLLLAGHNKPDRGLLTALLTALIHTAQFEGLNITDLVDELAPLGPKRMMSLADPADEFDLRPAGRSVRRVQPAQTARILDELGAWLLAEGLAEGEIPHSERTQILGKAVEHYFQLLTDAVARLSPDGLVEQLIARDEAVVYDAALTNKTVVSRIACFGDSGVRTQDLIKARQRTMTTALASRFLIEYVAATPPDGTEALTVERYDYLLALANEIAARGLLSDAIRYGFSDATLSLLPSGRLGVSRGDRFEAGTDAYRAARIEEMRKLAVEPAVSTTPHLASALDAVVEQAMEAEFGFTFDQMALGVGELVAFAERHGTTEPCYAPLAEVRAHLMSTLEWPESTADALLSALTLEPREQFLSVKADAYPWRFNRAYSYLRRPLIARTSSAEGTELLWGVRRVRDTGSYLIDLVYSGRLRARSRQMKHVCSTIRQGHNKDFERAVAQELALAGCDRTAYRVARVNGRKLESASGDDLGDIDALGLDSQHRLIVVGEAKDFEIARTPVEMANEAEDLIHGAKSAAFKTARRAQWVREHLSDVFAHFNIEGSPRGWNVEALIVTSRDLISPRVMDASVPAIAIGEVVAWMAERTRRRK